MESSPLRSSTAASGAVDASLAFVSHLGHHFIAKVSKTTPSGRQQSAYLVVFADSVCVLSNRGGLNRYVPLQQLVAVTVFPRARVCFHVAQCHDLLITCAQHPKLMNVLQSLFVGLTGSKLTVHQDDAAPNLDRLALRPVSEWTAKVPHHLLAALKEASLTAALSSLDAAEMALLPPLPASFPNAAPSSHERASSIAADLLPATEHETTNAVHVPTPVLLPPSANRDVSDAAAVETSRVKTLVILVVTSENSTVSVPAPLTLWEYIKAAARLFPGADCGPSLTVRCVGSLDSASSLQINAALMYQTMAVFSSAQSHMVTLQKRHGATKEGHHFAGSIFWASLAETAGSAATTIQ